MEERITLILKAVLDIIYVIIDLINVFIKNLS